MQNLKTALLARQDIRSLALFRRQYLQRLILSQVQWPAPELLRIYAVQQWIWAFVAEAQKRQPCVGYDRSMLKFLQTRIEDAVKDSAEPDVLDNFAELYVELDLALSHSDNKGGGEYVWIQWTPPWYELDPSRPEEGILVWEKPNVIAADGSTGHCTWQAALHLATWLEDGSMVRGKRFLELGAGTGLLSLIAARQGASSVMATDGNASVVERFKLTSAKNEINVASKVYEWGEDISQLEQDFDVVMGADVTYDRSSIPTLVSTLKQLASSDSKPAIWVCATERNRETLSRFLEECKEAGLKVAHLSDYSAGSPQTGLFHSVVVPMSTMLISNSRIQFDTILDASSLSRFGMLRK